jgi:hypothetical protein
MKNGLLLDSKIHLQISNRAQKSGMVEKFDQFEAQKVTSPLIDSLQDDERRQVMAAFRRALRFYLMPKLAGNSSGPRPTFKRKSGY